MKRAYVIGSGPNGLTAAIELQRASYSTTVLEARQSIGGGLHSAELTLPGFIHDVCSAAHPMTVSSPIFKQYPLQEHGLEWIHPDFPLAHPLDGGRAAILARSVDETAERLGGEPEYRRLATSLTRNWDKLFDSFFRPLRSAHHPFLMAGFGLHALRPATREARAQFQSEAGRALFGGLAAHSILPLTRPLSAAFGWIIGIAGHAVGWPIARGGSQAVANALGSYFESLGGKVIVGNKVNSLRELGDGALIFCDVGPREFLRISDGLPPIFETRLKRFQYGPGAFKVDWALSGPIPWSNADCRKAGTVHVAGTLEEVIESEQAPWQGEVSRRPYVLLVQPSVFDSTRAPAGNHTAWAYIHVPNGSAEDYTDRMEAQIERFAPGFQQLILRKHIIKASEWEEWNPNYTGGDVVGGAHTLLQLALRPTARLYRTPLKGVYLCSASTPPGGGIHGMCGYHAVRAALADAALTARAGR
jgi:phytoene dehydrogenase-like protein